MTATIKRFVVRFGDDDEVCLEVDTTVLTEALATEINTFYGNAESRLWHEGGDVVRVVVRMFGANVLQFMSSEGWADVHEEHSDLRALLMKDVLEWLHEGWPDAEGLGISIVEAFVEAPAFDTVSMEARA